MAITSIGYDGTVDEVQFQKIMGYSSHATFGVNAGGAFKASTVAGQVLQVKISSASGTAVGWTSGVVDFMSADETVQMETTGSGSRWDMIVLRRDYQPPGGTTSLEVIKGGARKKLPDREADGGLVEEQPLWLVRIDAGKTTASEYVDLRLWARSGGFTAKDDLVRSYMSYTGTQIEINGTLWLYKITENDTSEWVRLIEPDTGWVAGSVAASWNAGGGYLRCRAKNGVVEIRGRIEREPYWEQYVPKNGNIQNRKVGSIPSKFAPPAGPTPALTSSVSGPVASYHVDSAGDVYIDAVTPGTELYGDFTSTFSGMYFVD